MEIRESVSVGSVFRVGGADDDDSPVHSVQHYTLLHQSVKENGL